PLWGALLPNGSNVCNADSIIASMMPFPMTARLLVFLRILVWGMRMRLFRLAALLGCSTAIALSSLAGAEAQQPAQQFDIERTIQKYFDDMGAKKYQQALADTDALNPEPSNKDGRAMVMSMRASALLGLKRDSEVQQIVRQIHDLSPQDPAANMIL